MARTPASEERKLTFTERARRAQLIEVTIDLVAANGYAGTSLAGIAQGAEITKAAVLYHYPSKDAVVQAAYLHVLVSLATTVGSAVERAGPGEGPAAYIRSMIGHLREHPHYTRMIVEAVINQHQDDDGSQRWRNFAEIMATARRERGLAADGDLRTTAIMIGGAIDGIVGERMADPDYDTVAAAEELVQMTELVLFA